MEVIEKKYISIPGSTSHGFSQNRNNWYIIVTKSVGNVTLESISKCNFCLVRLSYITWASHDHSAKNITEN